jgi:hypothetical protein
MLLPCLHDDPILDAKPTWGGWLCCRKAPIQGNEVAGEDGARDDLQPLFPEVPESGEGGRDDLEPPFPEVPAGEDVEDS